MLLFLQALTVVLLVLVTWLVLAAMLAWARLRPPRLTDAKALAFLKRLTPEDLGLPYEKLEFSVPCRGDSGRAIRLKAWFTPHPCAKGRLVVVLHGYSDAKIGAAAWLPLLHDLEVNVLMLDLPAHGDSEGVITTAGWYERHQVAEVLKQLAQVRPGSAEAVVLYGISMGAAIALATACVAPSLAGVIVDSPFSDIRRAAIRHAEVFGFPGALLQVPASMMTEMLLGIRYGEVAPVKLLREVPCPVLLIESGMDPLVSREDAELMQDAAIAKSHQDGKSRVVVIANAPHILGMAADPEKYRAAVAQFLQTTLQT